MATQEFFLNALKRSAMVSGMLEASHKLGKNLLTAKNPGNIPAQVEKIRSCVQN
jgi:hypothetical protein